jgi:hypothetical protein
MTMQLPSVVHPRRFSYNDMLFEVVSYVPLTDTQAAKVVQLFIRGRKFKKSDQGKVFRVLTQFDAESAGML